jgi:hypothetical protein
MKQFEILQAVIEDKYLLGLCDPVLADYKELDKSGQKHNIQSYYYHRDHDGVHQIHAYVFRYLFDNEKLQYRLYCYDDGEE